MSSRFFPAGYLYKLVATRPDWLSGAKNVTDVHAISNCISDDFADYIHHWKHNGYWLFDSPSVMHEIADGDNIDMARMTLFYYEVFGDEFTENSQSWSAFDPNGTVAIVPPNMKTLSGFDVCSFSQRNAPECSPLSCNGLAAKLSVNAHCLFDTFEQAERALNQGLFQNTEPGPFRIFAVYTVTSETET